MPCRRPGFTKFAVKLTGGEWLLLHPLCGQSAHSGNNGFWKVWGYIETVWLSYSIGVYENPFLIEICSTQICKILAVCIYVSANSLICWGKNSSEVCKELLLVTSKTVSRGFWPLVKKLIIQSP